jgi:hypothetical protein
MGIELAEFIRKLRAELNEARQEAQNEELQFDVGPIEVELAVEAQREGSGGGGLKIYVVEAGAHKKVADVSTQRIKLSLTPSVPATKPAAERGAGSAQSYDFLYGGGLVPWSSSHAPTDLNASYTLMLGDGTPHEVSITPRTDRTGVRVEHPGGPSGPKVPFGVDG